MSRIDHLVEHLKLFGPLTTEQIAAVFGLKFTNASSLVSKAHAYGRIKSVGRMPVKPSKNPYNTHRAHIWGPR